MNTLIFIMTMMVIMMTMTMRLQWKKTGCETIVKEQNTSLMPDGMFLYTDLEKDMTKFSMCTVSILYTCQHTAYVRII
jgi:uncharacterized membrane protein YcaP (DUF421 family)